MSDQLNLQIIFEKINALKVSVDKVLEENKNLQYVLFANKLKDEIEWIKPKVNDTFSSNTILDIIHKILEDMCAR